MQDRIYGYSQQELNDFEIICFDKKSYMPLTLHRGVKYLYHLYINYLSGIRLEYTIRQVCYWKGLVLQVGFSLKMCKKFQHFKNRKTVYGNMTPNIIAALKPWNFMNINLIVPYSKSIIQQQPGGAIINIYLSLTYITIIDPSEV